jgi:hypothetical protein
LEKADFLFEESAKMTKYGQQEYIHTFFPSAARPAAAPRRPTVLPSPLSQKDQTKIDTFFTVYMHDKVKN